MFAQQGDGPRRCLAAAIARVGRGPLLVAGTDCPRLGAAHAAAALDDLAAGCDVVFGATLEGGWYLAGLREPRPELLTIAPEAWQRARRHRRSCSAARASSAPRSACCATSACSLTPGDVAALLADPLLPSRVCGARARRS